MYLCFIDESGFVPSKKRAASIRNFVIAALIIPEVQWQGIATEFHNAKRRFNVDGEVKWYFFGPDNDDPKNPMLHLSADERSKLRDALLKTVLSRRSCRIVATRARLEAAWDLPYVKSKTDIYHFTYKQTLERVNYFLQDVSKATGELKRGLIVADQRGAEEDRLFREFHAKMTERASTFTSDFKHFVERVMLTDSRESVGIQLVDIVAGAIGRAFNHDEPSWIEKLRKNIRSHPKKGIDGYGIVHWPRLPGGES